MKKSTLSLIIFAIALIGSPLYYYNNKNLEEKWSLARLDKKTVANNHSDILVNTEDVVPTIELAIQIAEPILKTKYGAEMIESQKPFSVSLADNIWIVEGTRLEDEKGKVASIRINKNTGAIVGLSKPK